jgi:cell division protein FtsZ
MSLNINVPQPSPDLSPKITVIGVGGAGGNAVNNMIQTKLDGVEFLVTNTDAKALQQSICDRRLQLGRGITQGLGAGSRPDIGRAAAEEALDDILTEIEHSHMVFVTAGMGGGTGTGAAPVIARAAREAGILTVGVVTKPFHFEGVHRMRLAEEGINDLTQYVDTLIIIPNQNLFRVANEKTTFADAFKMADDVLESGVRGVTDLMVNPGLINLDFADIRSVMSEMGKAMMGTGEGDGENRAIEAAESAINNPLLDEISMKGARGVLINITGGMDLTLFEVDEAANRIRDEVDPEANIIFGSTFREGMDGHMRVSVVATGIEAEVSQSDRPVSLSVIERGAPPRSVAMEPSPATARTGLGVPTGFAASTVAMRSAPEPEVAPQAVEVQQPEPVQEDDFSEPREIETAEPELAVEAHFDTAETTGEAATEVMAQQVFEEPHAGGSFFAPPPAMEPTAPVVQPQSPTTRPEPFAEADLANAARSSDGLSGPEPGRTEGRRASSSLFARVTGAARALQAATAGSADAASRAPVQRPHEPVLGQVQPQPVREREVTAQRAPSQPRLTGVEATEKVRTAEAEEDLLDIPAFLRRQAN